MHGVFIGGLSYNVLMNMFWMYSFQTFSEGLYSKCLFVIKFLSYQQYNQYKSVAIRYACHSSIFAGFLQFIIISNNGEVMFSNALIHLLFSILATSLKTVLTNLNGSFKTYQKSHHKQLRVRGHHVDLECFFIGHGKTISC